jgi:hypothetical protein
VRVGTGRRHDTIDVRVLKHISNNTLGRADVTVAAAVWGNTRPITWDTGNPSSRSASSWGTGRTSPGCEEIGSSGSSKIPVDCARANVATDRTIGFRVGSEIENSSSPQRLDPYVHLLIPAATR